MLLSLIAVVSALLTVSPVVSSPTPLDGVRTAYTLKSFHHVPRKWSRIGEAPSDHVLSLQIGLKQGRFDEVLKHLNEGKSFPYLLSTFVIS
jgi:tripeptidyl-peptidase-1